MKIEIYKTVIETYMTFEEANKYCVELGDGWRLPTETELIFLLKNRYKINL